MRRRWATAERRCAAGLALATMVVPALLLFNMGFPSGASSGTTPPSVTSVLAIPSPLALPACSAAGSASLLVPILGGVAQSDLGLPKSLTIGNLLLTAAGPVYVVCGDLPSSPNTQCQLDSKIAGIWPSTISSEGLNSPNPVGDTVNSMNAALAALDLPPSAALEAPLSCSVVAIDATAPAAPPAAPASGAAPALVPTTTTLPLPTTTLPAPTAVGLTSGGSALPQPSSVASPSTSVAAAAPSQSKQPGTGLGQSLSSLSQSLPGGILALQLALAILLALFIGGAWLTSGHLVGRNRRALRAEGEQ